MSGPARPFARLEALAREQRTGEVIVAADTLEFHVYLQEGRVAWATASSQPMAFSRFLRERAAIDDATYREVVEACRRDRLPLGETLVSWGLVTWENVREGLQHQIAEALGALAELAEGQLVFLERQHYTAYDRALTLALDELAPLVRAGRPTPALRPLGLAAQLLDAVPGARWVEVHDDGQLVDRAPAGRESRVAAALVERTLDDAADFVAIRAADGSLVGVRFADGLSAWCDLAPDATFGAAVATLTGRAGLTEPRDATRGEPARADAAVAWEAGGPADATTADLRRFVERTAEVIAACVLSPAGEVALGLGRAALPLARCAELVTRRARLLGGEAFGDAAPRERRSLVTGEPTAWCFGADLGLPDHASLWLVTERAVSQGLGWSLLAALGRTLGHGGGGGAARR